MNSFSRISSTFFVILTYVFLYLPIIVLVAFSFNTKTFPSPFEQFTLKWYHQLFLTPDLWQAFFNSLVVALSSTLLSLFLGMTMISFHIYGSRIQKMIPFFYGNLVIPETVLALALTSFFSFCNITLGVHTLIVSHTVIALGFVVPILYVRYTSLDPRLIEASLVLGATPLQTFFKVIIPQLRPAIISIGLLVFVISFDDFILSYFCSGTSFQTLSVYLISSLRYGISPVVNALSTLLLLGTSVAVMIFCSPKVKTRIF
ncbi:MAG: ABC transporter permease [Simkaniaceae bacterium]|nr:ABC transporter permease [Simkaniaceae bacterium]MCF7852349.1 ABC transporter permease [Simkaniaceae bacterium]